MFEHLDDHTPVHTGTSGQLAAVRNRARQLTQSRRKNMLAVGSATLAATASVSAVALVASSGSSQGVGQLGSSGSAPAELKTPAASAKPPAPDEAVKKSFDPSVDALKASRLADAGLRPSKDGNVNPAVGRGKSTTACSPALAALSGVTPPDGYSIVDTPNPQGAVYSASGGVAVNVKVTCAPMPSDETTTTGKRTVTVVQVGGHPAFLWQDHGESGVEWNTRVGAIYVQATGPDGSRLSDDQLEAFAATLPTA